MDSQLHPAPDMEPEPSKPKQSIVVPLIALGLDLMPLFLSYLGSIGLHVPRFSLITILCPICGLLTGVAALNQGKQRLGTVGVAIATLAVALPAAVVALIVLFFIGAYTGLISLM